MSAPHILWETPLTPPPRRVPFEDYLADERRSETRSEWIDGVVRAMGGGLRLAICWSPPRWEVWLQAD